MTISPGYSVSPMKQIGIQNLHTDGSAAAKNNKPSFCSGDLICHPYNCAQSCLMSDKIGRIFKKN